MSAESDIRLILAEYPLDCQPIRAESLGAAGGFSGAQLWRLDTRRGPACLRRWPTEHPTRERLEFIQAVLWHVDQEGFQRIPLPWETRNHAGYVQQDGVLWQLEPWLAGRASYHEAPSKAKLAAALTTLAQFHKAAESFPLPYAHRLPSPGIAGRSERLAHLAGGGVDRLAAAVKLGLRPDLDERARRLLHLFREAQQPVAAALKQGVQLNVPLQPCIRDIWHDHVLFEGEEVTGLIDFGSLKAESIAADIARLLGSLIEDDEADWQAGLAAYQTVIRLTADELFLIRLFDRTSVLMSGLQWLEWLYLERRQFENLAAIAARLDDNLRRLARLTGE